MTLPALRLGAATSAYQIEGAVVADGRGVSIWDTLAARPGAVVDASDGTVACSSYDLLQEDLDLLAGLRARAYRFSVAWPRVQPTGSGATNPAGLDYYERLVDGLLDRGIEPLPTLYHWDLPQPLEDAGGWPARDTALRFVDYARVVADRLDDRVRTWSTMNEPWCSAFLGYAAGVHAPGRREPEAAYAAAHHLLLGHALAAQALPGLDVGIVLNLCPVRPEPGFEAVAELVDAIQNRLWLDPLADGGYPQLLLDRSPALADAVQDGDLAAVVGSAAWLGVNYYTPHRPGPDDGALAAPGADSAAFPYAGEFAMHPRGELTTMGWEVDPTGLEQVLLTVAARLPGLPLRVTENGAAWPDLDRDATGAVADPRRIDYLREHLAAVERARDQGAPVLDYLVWSLLDNWEWAKGYTQLFGLVEVARDGRRMPKQSYGWYAGLSGG